MPQPGTYERGFTLMGNKFGILGALAITVGILGAHIFGILGALKFGKRECTSVRRQSVSRQ